jgi:hypothetical protein
MKRLARIGLMGFAVVVVAGLAFFILLTAVSFASLWRLYS